MTFYVYGLNVQEQVPLDTLFKRPVVEKTQAYPATHAIDHEHGGGKPEQHETVADLYKSVEQIQQDKPALTSNQIMTSPVITLTPQTSIAEAQDLFESNRFRHLPVVDSEGTLIGMISDRDILRYMGTISKGNSYDKEGKEKRASINDPIQELMQKKVITASIDTDVRYIALLFVEQHIGAIPIMKEDKLLGIITRSDVLRTVMNNYELQLWV
jgi:acetoin utilization protein AcuB